jgi:hypothetical protein
MKEKPGVMIYFDVLPVLNLLSIEEKGMLFEAIVNYAKYGVLPELSERLTVIWPLIQQRLDFDEARYQVTVLKRKYSAYARWEKQNDRQPIPYSQWVEAKGYEQSLETEMDALA